MPEFLRLTPPAEAIRRWLQAFPGPATGSKGEISTELAWGRVLAAPVAAPHALPSFPRANVDGYAVRAEDTFGATASLPAYLRLAGEVPMGGSPTGGVGERQAYLVHTGGLIPEGSDARVML